MAETEISWADHVWNPTVGCTRVSAGCDNCYAFQLHDMRYAARKRQVAAGVTGKSLLPIQYAVPFSTVQLMPDRLTIPMRRRIPTRYFVDSMADLFHEDVPWEYLDRVFAAMMLAPQHQFLILTKRPEAMNEYLDGLSIWRVTGILNAAVDVVGEDAQYPSSWVANGAIQNVWLGVSVENQAAADERIPILRETPAAIRFLSVEPLIGAVDLNLPSGEVDWVICGGESGPRSRPMELAWARGVRDQCVTAGVPFFFKQVGEHDWAGDRVGKKKAGREIDGREWNEFPTNVRALGEVR